MWFAHGHIFIKWQKWDHNSGHCLKNFNPLCSLFICILTLLNYVVFIFTLTQGHLSRTSGFNILATDSWESVRLKGFCQQLTLQTASQESKGKTVQNWNWHFFSSQGTEVTLYFLQNESFSVKTDHWSNLYLSLSTSSFQDPERRSESLN